MQTARNHSLLLLAVAALCLSCTKKKPASIEKAGDRLVDTGAESRAADDGWIVQIARDNRELVKLAEASSGWAAFFGNELIRSVSLFQKDSRGNGDAQIGGARAALRLARAYRSLAQLQEELVEPYHTAQASRPDAASTVAWRTYVEGRLAQRRGNDTKARTVFEKVKEPTLLALARSAAVTPGEGGTAGPMADLLAGREGGADIEKPEGMSPQYFSRLRIRSLAAARRSRLGLRLWERVDHRAPDLITDAAKNDGLWDPMAGDAGQRLYAAVALDFLKGVEGWGPLYEAEAYLFLERPDAALTTLDALLAAPPKKATLAELVLSSSAGAEDLLESAKALKIQSLVSLGRSEEAKVLISDMGRATIAQRVRRATALSLLGRPVGNAFPADRGELTTLLNSRVAALGQSAKGATDVAELSLVDRYADELQREWADVLARTDKPAQAARQWSMSEDKTKAFAISARNSISSLVASSLAALRIGQFRVSLKYLSRLDDNFPAAHGASEQLRDVLSYRAMAREGGVTTGQ